MLFATIQGANNWHAIKILTMLSYHFKVWPCTLMICWRINAELLKTCYLIYFMYKDLLYLLPWFFIILLEYMIRLMRSLYSLAYNPRNARDTLILIHGGIWKFKLFFVSSSLIVHWIPISKIHIFNMKH